MSASVIIPTYKGAPLIANVLNSLGKQSFKDFEVILVIKPCGDGTEDIAREICNNLNLEYKILIQHEGYFTHALNMGMKEAKGEIILFTDDDAILPKCWIEKHVNVHRRSPQIGALSGHIMYYDLKSGNFSRSDVEKPLVRLYRRLLQHVIEKPHPLFRNYRQGVYITNSFNVAAGPGIPYKRCLSLPVRGVNMSFKKVAVRNAKFPEHPLLKTGLYNEQYIGAQILLKGYDSLFDPSILVYHIIRRSLSRFRDTFRHTNIFKQIKESIKTENLEIKVIQTLLRDLFGNIGYNKSGG